MMTVTFQVDTSRLDRALRMAMTWSSATPEKIVQRTAFYVAVKAQNKTPYVHISTIDNELGTKVTLKKGSRGRPLSPRKAKNVIYSSGRTVGIRRVLRNPASGRLERTGAIQQVPMAALIINVAVREPLVNVRGGPSNFNKLTNFRWARAASPFRGVPRQVGAAAMREAVDRLIRKRHSATHFLMAGWVAVCRKLRAAYYAKGSLPDAQQPGVHFRPDMGEVTTTATGDRFEMTVANMVGMLPGRRGQNMANYNRALHERGGPALQAAVHEQAAEMTEHYLAKIEMDELRRVWDRFAWGI